MRRGLDQIEESEKYAGYLLKENKNYYGSLQDPIRFVDMINRLILATYVPGMSEVCSYAFANVAMHGVYTNGQEKILVMENGHRLNARSTNNGKLDYAICSYSRLTMTMYSIPITRLAAHPTIPINIHVVC